MKPATGDHDTAEHVGIVDRVRESTASELSRQKERATNGLGSVARAVRQSTQQLREQKHDMVAQYVERAANQLEQLSTRLKEKNVDEFVADAQRFARQRPGIFIGSAFALGVIGSRFFKSSERNRTVKASRPTTPARSTGYAAREMR
jgi:ElaB/YqjD/DUF883 family membrane-anchored ribosome-binding protein